MFQRRIPVTCGEERGRSRGIHGDAREVAFCAGRVLRDEIGGAGARCAGERERGPRSEAITQGLLKDTLKSGEDLTRLGRLSVAGIVYPHVRTGETRWSRALRRRRAAPTLTAPNWNRE